MSVKSRELIASLSSKANWILGFVVLITGMTAAVLIGAWSPVWVLVLLGSMLLYIAVRLRSRYDPLDPRFGSCIPPINMSRATDSTSPQDPMASSDKADESSFAPLFGGRKQLRTWPPVMRLEAA